MRDIPGTPKLPFPIIMLIVIAAILLMVFFQASKQQETFQEQKNQAEIAITQEKFDTDNYQEYGINEFLKKYPQYSVRVGSKDIKYEVCDLDIEVLRQRIKKESPIEVSIKNNYNLDHTCAANVKNLNEHFQLCDYPIYVVLRDDVRNPILFFVKKL